MERETHQPESPARRAARIARVGARYGFGFVFGSRFFSFRRKAEPGQIGMRLRLSLEELGPVFVELGRFLSTRGDLLPPDVAAELGRSSVVVKPVSPAEVRTLIERELGNDLERLFLEFERTPVRVGTFTQAHRAVLPGDRPALVVLDRPGVRRDLLAMRPVADLTRRRLGDRLPLNPSEAVTEFAAHAGQRRDMYASAQISRKLQRVADFGLHVPGIYRGYSAGRCITFEAPAVPESLNDEQYREVSDALIRLGLTAGIFFFEPSPERFTVDGDTGELWLADPTEMLSLDPERLRGLAEVLAAIRRGDVDGVMRALPLTGSVVPDEDSALRRELRDALGSLGGPFWQERSLAEIRDRVLRTAYAGGLRLQTEVAVLVHSLTTAENLGRGADGYVGTVEAARAAQVAISRSRDPREVASRTIRNLAQPETYADYPRQVHALLNELKDGEIEVQFRHGGLDDLISKVDILANRLVFALLIAALIVGSSLIGIFSKAGARILGVSVFGLSGFVIAAILGLALLVGIIRSGRL